VAEVNFLPAAQSDYDEALAWYLERSARAAAGFESAVTHGVHRIADDPETYPLIDKRHRRCLLKRYPFSLVYRIEISGVLVVAGRPFASPIKILATPYLTINRRMSMTPCPQHSRRAFLRDISLAGSVFWLQERLLLVWADNDKDKDSQPQLGINASLNGKRVFPADNPWNADISQAPVDPRSDVLIASVGLEKPLHPDFGPDAGIPYIVVPGDQPKKTVTFQYGDESDAGDYPIPDNAPIEGGEKSKGDRHVLVIDRDHWKLYELFHAFKSDGGWRANSGAIFDLNSNRLRPADWTSADAAGLPIFPGLVRFDEVIEQRAITHALRFTVRRTRRAYVPPARHFASRSKDPNLPAMGMRVRLKADYGISKFPASAQVILTALKKYGMMVADNGGDWFVTGAPHAKWNDDELASLKRVRGKDFEVVKMEGLTIG
jgi:plasmid stabilization system protein ParE